MVADRADNDRPRAFDQQRRIEPLGDVAPQVTQRTVVAVLEPLLESLPLAVQRMASGYGAIVESELRGVPQYPFMRQRSEKSDIKIKRINFAFVEQALQRFQKIRHDVQYTSGTVSAQYRNVRFQSMFFTVRRRKADV